MLKFLKVILKIVFGFICKFVLIALLAAIGFIFLVLLLHSGSALILI